MRIPFYTRQFKKDLKLSQKRDKDIKKLKEIMSALIEGGELAGKYKDHPLQGVLNEYRECHIEPDWLLIYRATTKEIIFERTGTHSDLFKK